MHNMSEYGGYKNYVTLTCSNYEVSCSEIGKSRIIAVASMPFESTRIGKPFWTSKGHFLAKYVALNVGTKSGNMG